MHRISYPPVPTLNALELVYFYLAWHTQLTLSYSLQRSSFSYLESTSMPSVSLTELSVRSLKASTQTDFWDTNLPGFGLRVGPRSKTFVFKHQNRRYTIGTWPELSLKEARDRARTRTGIAEGSTSITLSEAFETYKAMYLHNYRERSRREVIRLVEKHLSPRWTDRLTDISHHQLADIFDAIAPSEANHLYGVLRTFFTWAEKRELCGNPLKKLDRPHKSTSRSRILSDDEICRLWTATEEPTHFNAVIRLALLTGQRRGELSAIQLDWIVGDNLTIPANLSKNGHEHSVPFSDTCIALTKHLKPNFSAWSKSKATLDRRSGVTDWTIHDLRRTWASLAARWGIPEHLAARIQNHRSAFHANPIRAVYQRYEFRKEMQEAMNLFEQNLLTLVANHGSLNVQE